ncbi:MAG: GyrI-like domain-containing protein [Anaerolineae bacterium]
MIKCDLRQQYKALYTASSKEAALVEVPPLSYLMIDGRGDPNTAPEYQQAVEALYGLSYTLKFHFKQSAQSIDYPVMALEGLWSVPDLRDLSNRDKWQWTMMIMQPEWVTQTLVTEMAAVLAKKKPVAALAKVRLEEYTEGLAAQIMHIGPYAAEWPTIERLHSFVRESGYELHGKHHEIYLSDPRRTAPEKIKTILRHPVRKVTTK